MGITTLLLLIETQYLNDLKSIILDVDFVFHLAGTNRPENEEDFTHGNVELTHFITSLMEQSGRNIPIVLTSSIQAELDNPYGHSKFKAEKLVHKYMHDSGSAVYIYRLPNVFGKWCKPNYNSVIATFCYNIANGLPIKINDENISLSLVYIDDVCDSFIKL